MTLLLLAVSFLRLDPAVVTDCRDGLGRAVLRWSTTETATVVLYAGGSAISGPEGAAGTVVTDYWLSDGQLFTLRSLAGTVLARTTARVSCFNQPVWPLAVGNSWTFRVNTRQETGRYVTWRVVRQEQRFDETWAVLSNGTTEQRWRVDALGNLHRFVNNLDETLPLRPAGRVDAPAGTFVNTVSYSTTAFERETGTLERGVGLVKVDKVLSGGSSGGFSEGWTLVEAKVGDRLLQRELYGVSLQIDPEVYNCAVPCYFAACGMAGADLPGTVKACREARVEGAELVRAVNAAGEVVWEQRVSSPAFLRLPQWEWAPTGITIEAHGPKGVARSTL
jgi:hypothetical protein